MSKNCYHFGKNTKQQLIEYVVVLKTAIVELNPADLGSAFTLRAHTNTIHPLVHESETMQILAFY